MPVENTNLSDIPPDELAESEDFLVQALLEELPYLDLDQKVLRQVLIRPEAAFRALGKDNTDRVRQSFSLVEMTENPDQADDDTVESIIGNFVITRRVGVSSTGQVVIVLSTKVTTPLSGGVVLTSNGQTFTPTQPFIGVVNQDNIVSSRDRLITDRDDGTYAFVIDVVATETGSAGQLKQGAAFTIEPPVANMTKAYAESDFNEGVDEETTEELLNRFDEGVAARSTADRTSITAVIKDAYPQATDVSCIGAGDPEMLRDSGNLFGAKTGGRSDIYTRTTALPSLIKATKEAVLLDASARTWRVSFTRDEYPGLYRVEKIVQKDADVLGGYAIIRDARAADVTQPNGEYVPLIRDAAEAVYTAYQTVTLDFTDSDTPTAALEEGVSVREYDFYVRVMPNVQSVQTLLGSRGRQSPNGDYLVRAPMPCFVSVGLKVLYQSGTAAPDAKEIQDEIATLVNAVPFSSPSLPASIIINRVHELIGSYAYLDLPVDLRGTIRTQEGDEVYLRSTDALEIVTQANLSLSRRTTAFYLNPEDVEVEVVAATSHLPV